MTGEEAVAELETRADPRKAHQMAVYHKVVRRYLGVSNPAIDDLVREWGGWADLEARLLLADQLWRSNIHEAMIAAAKLVTARRFGPSDEDVWDLVSGWVDTFEGWATADHAAIAGQKRLAVDPGRIDTVATWTAHSNMWSRRAALVFTLPFAKVRSPSSSELAVRRTVLDWAAGYVVDHDWFIQKAVGWWLRELSKVDPSATRDFVTEHGSAMRAVARREAMKYL